MRGDLSLHLRMLVRPHGVIGVVGAVAGASALAACYLPWYEVTATVDLLDTSGARAVATVAMWEAHPWGWLGPALSVAVIVAGVLVAVDRPLPGDVLVWAGAGLGVTVALAWLLPPPLDRFDVAGTRLRELAAAADRLPRDVDLSFGVHAAVGMWLMLAAAALTVAAGLAARDGA